jgi:ribosomal protein S3
MVKNTVIKDSKILGMKIVCKGRWSKTNTGRKQYLRIVTGSLSSTSLRAKLSYSSHTVTTRYGRCSVRVWLKHCC